MPCNMGLAYDSKLSAPEARFAILPQAVALVCPPVAEGDARRTITDALCDGLLVEEPRPLWSLREASDFVVAAGDRDKDFALQRAALVLNPPPASPAAWRSRFADSRVDWETGEVLIPIRDRMLVETPIFDRAKLRALFQGAPLSSNTKRGGGRPPAADWDAVKEMLRLEIDRRGPPDREGPADWRTVTDAMRFVENALQKRGERVMETALRSHVSRILREIAAETGA